MKPAVLMRPAWPKAGLGLRQECGDPLCVSNHKPMNSGLWIGPGISPALVAL